MKAKEVLIAGTGGTTLMTLFSYLVSELDKENFSEPERLGELIHRLLPGLSKEQKLAAGWASHYAVGVAFAAVYVKLWEKRKLKPSFTNNLLLGGISGLAAIAIWKTTFKLHPLPPALSFNKYYLQLVPAHLVFAVFAGFAYNLLKSEGEDIDRINNNNQST